MEAMAMPLLQLPLTASPSSSSSSSSSSCYSIPKLPIFSKKLHHRFSCRPTKSRVVVLVGSNEEATELSVSSTQEEPDPQDLEYIRQIKRVLELLRKNRDMIFSEVKLTIMIEDPREVERRRLLGIEDADTPTREDLAAVLEEVNEGKVPKDRVALQMLAEEMIQWPNLEVEATKKKPGKSLYAKATDTGIDPKEAARRLNADWDSAAEIEDSDVSDDTEVPPALGYGALYLVTAFPVIIGISVFQMQLFLPQNTVEVDVHLTTEHPHHLDFPTSQGGAQEADEFYEEVEVDANMSPDHPYDFEKERLQKEKQISVDPISLQGSSMGKASFKLMLPPLPPAKGFLSCSLPNSANSSPRFNSAPLKKKSRDGSKANPRQVCNLARQHSAADDHVLTPLQRETYLRRSKSCYEGRARASADDFELWLTKPNSIEYDNKNDISFSKTEPNKDSHRTTRSMDGGDEEFKCGALCLFLPGFGKGKPVRAKKEVVDIEHVVNIENVISRRVSLEKFECGSWASSAITHDSEDDSKSLYFDLPLELIRTSVNDAHSPVTAAFFFDNDKKGVLKNGSARSTAKKSDESPRHVRFSLSSPRSHPTSPASCITPRLRKAREEFNAFLEAQGA